MSPRTDRWLRATVPVQGAEAEALAWRLSEAGALGAEIAEASVIAYFPADLGPARLSEMLRVLGDAPGTVDWLEAEPWAERWKEHFRPQRIGRLWIGAPWHERPAEAGALAVVINPGAAFGTGTHETTRLCLEILQDRLAAPAFNPWIVRVAGDGSRLGGGGLSHAAPSVLDVGTGSGILAIAAKKLGAGRVLGVDVDETAIASARENLDQNALSDEVALRAGGAESVADSFDVVLANLILGTILDAREALIARTRAGGALVLSGLLEGQGEEVEDAYGLEVLERRRMGDWIALAMRAP